MIHWPFCCCWLLWCEFAFARVDPSDFLALSSCSDHDVYHECANLRADMSPNHEQEERHAELCFFFANTLSADISGDRKAARLISVAWNAVGRFVTASHQRSTICWAYLFWARCVAVDKEITGWNTRKEVTPFRIIASIDPGRRRRFKNTCGHNFVCSLLNANRIKD